MLTWRTAMEGSPTTLHRVTLSWRYQNPLILLRFQLLPQAWNGLLGTHYSRHEQRRGRFKADVRQSQRVRHSRAPTFRPDSAVCDSRPRGTNPGTSSQMRRGASPVETPLHRWETVVPISADKNYITYKFKVDYLTRAFGKPEKDSRLSPSYRLDITDK